MTLYDSIVNIQFNLFWTRFKVTQTYNFYKLSS